MYTAGGGKIVSTYANRSVRNAFFMTLRLITEGLLHRASSQVWMFFQILNFSPKPTSTQGNEERWFIQRKRLHLGTRTLKEARLRVPRQGF